MTKKKTSKKSNNQTMIIGVLVALMGVLLLFPLFMPVVNSTIYDENEVSATVIELLGAKAIYDDVQDDDDEDEKYDAASDEVKAVYNRYYVTAPLNAELEEEDAGDKAISAVNSYSVVALIVAIIGGLGILFGVASLVENTAAKYIGFYAFLMAVAGIAVFVVGLIAAGACSSVSSVTILVTISTVTKASIGVGAILALVGGILAAVVPFGVKKLVK